MNKCLLFLFKFRLLRLISSSTEPWLTEASGQQGGKQGCYKVITKISPACEDILKCVGEGARRTSARLMVVAQKDPSSIDRESTANRHPILAKAQIWSRQLEQSQESEGICMRGWRSTRFHRNAGLATGARRKMDKNHKV